jgi:hypothetical protein
MGIEMEAYYLTLKRLNIGMNTTQGYKVFSKSTSVKRDE